MSETRSPTAFRPRWYAGGALDREPQGRVQVDSALVRHDDRRRRTLPEALLRLAHEEYDRQHPRQPYERMQERGGLSVLELVMLLGDHVERLKASQGPTMASETRSPTTDEEAAGGSSVSDHASPRPFIQRNPDVPSHECMRQAAMMLGRAHEFGEWWKAYALHLESGGDPLPGATELPSEEAHDE